MKPRIGSVFLVSMLIAGPPLLDASGQELEPVVDPDAYAVYASILPAVWPSSDGALLLQRETEGIRAITTCLFGDDDWSGVEANFKRANETTRLLQARLPLASPYRLIAHADIATDDKRLALKYPGIWQRRPESMEFAAVSSVGFDETKTRALVYVRLRSEGKLYALELSDGHWVRAKRVKGCSGWIV